MKKIAIIWMVALLALSMTACAGDDYYQTDSTVSEAYVEEEASVDVQADVVNSTLDELQPEIVYSEPQTEVNLFDQTQSTNQSQSKPAFQTQSTVPAGNGTLTPEEAVNIYMNNKSLWMGLPDYDPMCGYGYCLLDLDFDGVLELIFSLNDGTGRYSYNRFYRINRYRNTVEEFESSLSDADGIDYMYMANSSKLLKNQSTGKMFYLFQDYIRISSNEYGSINYECYLNNGELKENALFSEYKTTENEYRFAGSEVSKSQYDKKTKAFYADNKDMNLKWDVVSGEEFDYASTAAQKQMLLKAYRNFSYNGFSY